MTYSAKLVRGSYTFDLNDGKYSLGQDFTPPGVLETAFLSGGTSANRSGGADLVGTRAENRSWSFTVRCLGSVSAETHNLVSRLVSFLAGATDTRQDKTYFEFRPDADLPEPVWGTFGQALRYEVVHATTALDDLYGRGRINRNAILVMVNLTIKPYAQGRPIQAAVATGGIAEDRIGTVDGSSRGLTIERATTNFVKNPIFSHATPMNGWTATTVTATVSRKEKLFGVNSVLLSGAAGTFRATTATIAATGDHTLSCYAKRADGQPVTNADLKLSFNGALYTTVFQSIGNGWYRLSAVINVGALVTFPFGIDTLANGVAAYIDGWQFELGSLATAVCWGDMLGCSWSGTAHDSSSSRIKGAVILTGEALAAKPISAMGTIRVSLIFNGSVSYCFSKSTGTAFRGYVQTNALFFESGATSISPAIAPVLARGDVITIYFTWTRTAIAVYLNGVLKSSTAGAISNIIDILHIGSHFTNSFDGPTITDFAIFDQALTDPQVAADYARIQPLKDAKVNIGRIPWIYTKEVVSNVNRVRNALDTNNSNFAAIGGVPGSAEANINVQFYTITTGYKNILLSRYETKDFIHPRYLYMDTNDTLDAACSGGGYTAIPVDTYNSQFPLDVPSLALSALAGRNVYMLVRLDDLGTQLSVRAEAYFGYLGDIKTSNWAPFIDTGIFRQFLTFPLFFPELDTIDNMILGSVSFSLGHQRVTATANMKVDCYQILTAPILNIFNDIDWTLGVLHGGHKANTMLSTGYLGKTLGITGDDMTLIPDTYNVLRLSFNTEGSITPIDRYTEIPSLILFPRWHLL